MKYGSGICLFLLFLHNTWDYGHGYQNQRLQDYLCADKFIYTLQKPFKGDQTVTLNDDGASAVIITQMWNSTLPGLRTTNKLKHDCDFRVQTTPRQLKGIYTVITRLKFRHNPQTGECMDYIQFSNGNRLPSERICNDISVDGPGRLIFDQRDHDVKVHIHIDKNHVINEPLELRMVLTAHSDCKYTGDFLCDPKDPLSCISRHFVRDNITNCMYPCRDEISCFHDAITTEEIDTANVALSAITSLIFTMLGVGFCVWICWKYWNCITVQQHAHEASAAAHQLGARNAPTLEVPTAPDFHDMLTVGHGQQHQSSSHQPQTPKDLPPSYESLFPDR